MKHKVGDIRVAVIITRWKQCEECGEPATHKLTFLLENARRNPASSAYGMDDCSWCSDHVVFACRKHKDSMRWREDGFRWCAEFPLSRFKHMGFYEEELDPKKYNEIYLEMIKDRKIKRLKGNYDV